MLANPLNTELACLISIIGLSAAAVLLRETFYKSPTSVIFSVFGWFGYLMGELMILMVFLLTQKSDLHLLIQQWMTFVGVSIMAAFVAGEITYKLKVFYFPSKKLQKKS
jgi:drug/metabolite transporter (DMT)-like permease